MDGTGKGLPARISISVQQSKLVYMRMTQGQSIAELAQISRRTQTPSQQSRGDHPALQLHRAQGAPNGWCRGTAEPGTLAPCADVAQPHAGDAAYRMLSRMWWFCSVFEGGDRGGHGKKCQTACQQIGSTTPSGTNPLRHTPKTCPFLHRKNRNGIYIVKAT